MIRIMRYILATRVKLLSNIHLRLGLFLPLNENSVPAINFSSIMYTHSDTYTLTYINNVITYLDTRYLYTFYDNHRISAIHDEGLALIN